MILILGSNGMLGSEIAKYFYEKEEKTITSDIKGECDVVIDITKYQDIYNIVKENRISTIINCAAYTNVDAAEDVLNKKTVDSINIEGVKNLAKISKEFGCKFVYFSTDYVFDGIGDTPITENNTNKNPINYYGKTKLEGERIVERIDKYFIIRIQWLYGENGKNFVDTMIDLSKKSNQVKVVCDQIGTPTYAVDVAKLVYEIIKTDNYGYFNIANEGGYVSWYDFCKYIYIILLALPPK